MQAQAHYDAYEIESDDDWVKLSETSQVFDGTLVIESGMENGLIRINGGASKRLPTIACSLALLAVDISTIELFCSSGTLKVSLMAMGPTP